MKRSAFSSIHDNVLFHRGNPCFIFRAPTVRFISKTKSTPYEVLFVLEASPRLELGVRILQTLALPLGYDAVLNWSGRRDSDPRLSPWQGDTLPLSHSRRIDCLNNISKEVEFCNKFLILFCSFEKICCKSGQQFTFTEGFGAVYCLLGFFI